MAGEVIRLIVLWAVIVALCAFIGWGVYVMVFKDDPDMWTR